MGAQLPVTRRSFLRAALAASAPWVVPRCVLGRLSPQGSASGGPTRIAPSERITLGFIGIGMMGRGHLRCFLGFDDAQVLAVCDVDQWRRNAAQQMVEEHYGQTQPSGTYRACRAYTDLRELVDRTDIDAVVIATGDRWHAPATLLAAQSGKDVYCEKPISLTIREARAMVEVVRRHDRVFQAGLQQRSAPEFQTACRLVHQGAIGPVERVYVNFPGTSSAVNLPAEPVPEGLDWDLWLGPAPWRPFNSAYHHYGEPRHVVPWHFCRDFGGGNLTSNAVHAFDVVQWALKMDHSGPVEIIPPDPPRLPALTYKYANGVVLQVVGRQLDPQLYEIPQGWPPGTPLTNFGALYVGRDGWIQVGRQGHLRAYPPEVLSAAGLGAIEPGTVIGHQRNWLDCVRSRRRPACDVETGCRSTTVSHLGCIAHWTRRSLRWDPAKEAFIGDEEANRLLSRAAREPWRV